MPWSNHCTCSGPSGTDIKPPNLPCFLAASGLEQTAPASFTIWLSPDVVAGELLSLACARLGLSPTRCGLRLAGTPSVTADPRATLHRLGATHFQLAMLDHHAPPPFRQAGGTSGGATTAAAAALPGTTGAALSAGTPSGGAGIPGAPGGSGAPVPTGGGTGAGGTGGPPARKLPARPDEAGGGAGGRGAVTTTSAGTGAAAGNAATAKTDELLAFSQSYMSELTAGQYKVLECHARLSSVRGAPVSDVLSDAQCRAVRTCV